MKKFALTMVAMVFTGSVLAEQIGRIDTAKRLMGNLQS